METAPQSIKSVADDGVRPGDRMITKQSVLPLSYEGLMKGPQSEYHCIVRFVLLISQTRAFLEPHLFVYVRT